MKLEAVMMFLGAGLLVVSWAWYVVVGFKEKFTTGLGNLLLAPIVPLIYTVIRPKKTYIPFVMALVGIALIVGPAILAKQ